MKIVFVLVTEFTEMVFRKAKQFFGQGTDRGTIIEEAVNATKNDDTTEVHFIYEDIIKKKGRS